MENETRCVRSSMWEEIFSHIICLNKEDSKGDDGYDCHSLATALEKLFIKTQQNNIIMEECKWNFFKFNHYFRYTKSKKFKIIGLNKEKQWVEKLSVSFNWL